MKDRINLSHPVFKMIARAAEELGVETYAVGGYVRDVGSPGTELEFAL